MYKGEFMRKVNMTKQQTVKPNAKWFGFSLKQIITMAVGAVVAISTLILFIFTLKISTEITMLLVFVEIVVTVCCSIMRVNGMSLVKWLLISMQGPIFRPYQSKGAKYYEEDENDK